MCVVMYVCKYVCFSLRTGVIRRYALLKKCLYVVRMHHSTLYACMPRRMMQDSYPNSTSALASGVDSAMCCLLHVLEKLRLCHSL